MEYILSNWFTSELISSANWVHENMKTFLIPVGDQMLPCFNWNGPTFGAQGPLGHRLIHHCNCFLAPFICWHLFLYYTRKNKAPENDERSLQTDWVRTAHMILSSVRQVEQIMLVFLWRFCVPAQHKLVPRAVMIVLYPNLNLILSFRWRSDQNIPALLVKKCFWSASSEEPNLLQQQKLTVSFVSFGRASRVAVNQSQMVIFWNIHLKMSQSLQDFKYFLH